MKIVFLLSAAILFASCLNNKKTTPDSVPVAKLTQASLYNIDSIRLALNTASVDDEQAATRKFLEAIDMIKNQNQVFMSIESFKASLYLYPFEKTYFELANAQMTNLEYKEALQSLHIAEMMNYSPLANVMYKTALVYTKLPAGKLCADGFTKWNDSLALHYMEIALQMGYSKPREFLENREFDSLRINNDWQFKSIYETALSGSKDPEKLIWDDFKNGFKQITLPLNINTIWIYQQTYDKAIGYDYEKFVPEMRNAKFSREVDNEYYYIGKLKDDSAYSSVLYAGKNMWVVDGRGYSPIYFLMVTYSPEGKIIDKMHVAGQKTFGDIFKTLIIKENLNFEVKEFKNIYEKDPEKDGYVNNNIAKSDPISTNYYSINAAGKIQKLNKDEVTLK